VGRYGYDEVVFLTGLPSFAAVKMLEALVQCESPRAWVYALVTEAHASVASETLRKFSRHERDRIQLLEGDPAAIDMGLSGAELRSVAPEVDVIHHMAQASTVIAERRELERLNLGGAREMLELASLCPSLRCAAFHSSAGVSGNRQGAVLEEDLDPSQGFRNAAEETLARSEAMVRRAMPALPLCVIRPTLTVGDSRSGEVDPDSGAHAMIALFSGARPELPLPVPGLPDVPLHVMPVDYYVNASLRIARDRRARGRTFHVGDPNPPSVKQVIDLVTSAAGRVGPRSYIPPQWAKALLKTPGVDRLARSPRPFLDALSTHVIYSFANTAEVLGDSDLRCAPFESYVEALVENVQARMRDKRSREAGTDVAASALNSPPASL